MSQRIFLRAFEYDDLDILNAIRNDEEGYLYTAGNRYYISHEFDKKWIEDKIFNNKENIYLAICLINTNEVVGYLSINEIDHWNKKAQWGGINIAKKYWRNGFATEAAILMLRFVFEELNMNRFWGYWLVSNKESIRMSEKLGFKIEGTIRDLVFKKNKYHNAYVMSVLRSEYEVLYGHNR